MIISNNYKLEKEIGSGTFGKVYLGEHIPTKSPLAIKILDKSKINDKSDYERVSRELMISSTILHPHLVQLFDMLETDGYIFLIMEFLEGGELYDYIVSKRRLDEQEAFAFFIQIVSALEYLHKINIVHRDLKPENLLLDKNKKKLKLVDFGLGRFYNLNSKIETACGSPCYAPPEMLSKHKYEPIKADIWSLGIVLFAMLSGFLPFDDDNTDKLYEKIIEGKFSIPEWISAEAKDILTKIINKNPDERINLQQIKQHSWFLNNMELLQKLNFQICCFKSNHESFYKLNKDIVQDLVKKGYNEKTIVDQVQNNNHSEIYCFYHILRNLNSQNQIKPQIEPKRNFKKSNNQKSDNKKSMQNKITFKKYSGPVDIEFLCPQSPLDVFNELLALLEGASFQVQILFNSGSMNVVQKNSGISFQIKVVQFIDFEFGSYLIFDKIKPKEKFEQFYQNDLQKIIKPIFKQLVLIFLLKQN